MGLVSAAVAQEPISTTPVQTAQAAPSAPAPQAGAPAPAQQGPWEKLAPFPEPSEELYGIPANGKFYVFGGLAPGWKPKALVFEYDPGANTWTRKKPMALPSHHVALAE